MNEHSLEVGIALTWVAVLAGGWLGWQLLRQNGRLLLRLEELEKRLDKLEFGERDQPLGLPIGSAAPAFDLPDLAGERKSLAQYRGHPLLLIFFNPACGFCRELLPKLAALATERGRSPSAALTQVGETSRPVDGAMPSEPLRTGTIRAPSMLLITTGSEEANRQLFDEHKITHPVLLQKASEVVDAYKAMGTPSGYLIDDEGKIASRLAMGGDALLKLLEGKVESRKQKAEIDQVAGNGAGRADRFSNCSLARSKLKRDGLKAGTPAPDFRLPRLDGRGELSLSELRGRRVLLVFSSPGCGPCNSLAPELEKFHREQTEREVGRVTPCAPQAEGSFQNGAHGVARPTLTSPSIAVVMISKGEPKENRAKIKEHELTFPVVLQQQWEVSRRYAMFATPIAYLIDEAGVIARDVAVGADAILEIMTDSSRSGLIEGTRASVNLHS